MKPAEIEELRRLEAGAIGAPWEADADADNIDGSDCVVVRGPSGNPAIAAVWTLHAEASLAAAARNALPRLLKEREMLLEALRPFASEGTKSVTYRKMMYEAGMEHVVKETDAALAAIAFAEEPAR